MLDAKKLGHSIYAFSRKNEFYYKLNQMVTNGDDQVMSKLNKYILAKDLEKFSLFFEHLTQKEKNVVQSNLKQIEQMLLQNRWHKGEMLLSIVSKDVIKQSSVSI